MITDPTPNAPNTRNDKPTDEKQQSTPTQLDLLDHGRHAAATRATAARTAIDAAPGRRDRIELFVASCGDKGATRFEISERLSIPYTSVCGPVLKLLTAGRIRETSQTRPTRYGSPAAVLVSAMMGLGDG